MPSPSPRVAMREPDLPRLTVDQLDVEATRVRNRLHAPLLVLTPGYRRDGTGTLSNKTGLATAKRLVLRGRAAEPVRGKLALAAISRLRQLEREADDLEAEIKSAVAARQPTRLLEICGVGPIIAAKILGETRGVERFRQPPHSRPTPAQHPCQPPAARPHDTASIVAGTASSTALFTIAMVEGECCTIR